MVEILAIIVRWMAGLCTTGERLAGMFPIPASARVSFHTLPFRGGCRGEVFSPGICWKSMRLEPVPFAYHGEPSFVSHAGGDPVVYRLPPPAVADDFACRAFRMNGLFFEGTDACAPPFGG